ncbi:MAG TPA: hypothetical protein VL443_08210 [Cyclobacteriaceae bacterium]|jgi:hypothetical protein|nr:hypothetical protein [Cyclobacteriaceae bacterium]
MKTRIGYGFYGFMADERWKNGAQVSSPDGSSLHVFSIVNEFLNNDYQVHKLFPNRDKPFLDHLAKMNTSEKEAFKSFSQEKRYRAYKNFIDTQYTFGDNSIEVDLPDVDIVLLEWRMQTKRNVLPMSDPDFDPDLMIQDMLIDHYSRKGVPIIALDLDYKMTPEDDARVDYVLELGFKRGEEHHYDIPFDVTELNQFQQEQPERKIVYVGNRYDRDDAFQKFFGTGYGTSGREKIFYDIYGNWLEGEKDSKIRWPHIRFHHRAQPKEFHTLYKNSVATPLILKDEYNEHGFMTVRIIETLLFGSIPLLPSDFKSPITYVPKNLVIDDEYDMLSAIKENKLFSQERTAIRRKLIQNVQIHSPHYFVRKIEQIVKGK